MSNDIVIVDYHCGNPASIRNMLKKIGSLADISNDKETIKNAKKLILPGVGAFDHGMDQLEELDIISILEQKVIHDKTPILGICLGVQLFCHRSEEGKKKGLGWIDANVIRFDKSKIGTMNKIPHMGWAETHVAHENSLITSDGEVPRYYYVHSYHLQCHNQAQVLATATHGYEFVTAVEKDNILGVQFHPEKSHRFGMTLLKNFIENY